MTQLRSLLLSYNELSGGLPAELSGLRQLLELHVANNPELAGTLPAWMTSLTELRGLLTGGTDLCAPSDSNFRA